MNYDLKISDVEAHINYFLALEPRPDAILAIHDPAGIEVIRVLKQRDIRIPEDIAVVGFSNDVISSFIEPTLTTVEQSIHELGSVAAKLPADKPAQRRQQPGFLDISARSPPPGNHCDE